jgi:hypothetical protein
MSFLFSDGSALANAFEYDWRLWSPSELSDALREVGFADVAVYDRMGSAVDGEGRLVVQPAEEVYAEAIEVDAEPVDDSTEETGPLDWVCYVVGRTEGAKHDR